MTWVRWLHQIHKLAGYFCHEYWNGLKCRAWKNPMHTNCDSEFYQKMLSTIKQKEKMGLQVSKGKMHNNPKFSVGRSENRLPTLQGGIPGKVYMEWEVGMRRLKQLFWHCVDLPKHRCFETLLRSVVQNTQITWPWQNTMVHSTPVMAGGVPAASTHSWDKDSHFWISTLIDAEPCNDCIHVFDITHSVYHTCTCKTKQYLSLII